MPQIFHFSWALQPVPREIENNAYAKFVDGGKGGKLGALWEMCKWRVDIILQPRPQGEKKGRKKEICPSLQAAPKIAKNWRNRSFC